MSSETEHSQDVLLSDFIKQIWQQKWLIMAITGFFSIAAVLYALSQPNVYRAEVVLAPAESDQNGRLGALAGQLGGLASFAGINLGAQTVDSTAIALEILVSRKFISSLIESQDMLVPLMAASEWDWESQALILNEELYDSESNTWIRQVDPPKMVKPSLLEAVKEFRKLYYVDQSTDNGMVTIAIEHYSPHIAQQWVNAIVESINLTIKQRDIVEAEQSIDYLQEQAQASAIAELRTVFYQLIEEQTKTLMLANVSDEYAFKIIDPAVVPEEKFKPKRALIAIAGFILGVLLSLAITLVLAFKTER